MKEFGDEKTFWDTCVDLEVHQKPEIRLHRALSYFNITNFAQFENIRFTAVDALATSTDEVLNEL